jgi:ribosomal protein L9
MNKTQNSKQFDLEERTLKFSEEATELMKIFGSIVEKAK